MMSLIHFFFLCQLQERKNGKEYLLKDSKRKKRGRETAKIADEQTELYPKILNKKKISMDKRSI